MKNRKFQVFVSSTYEDLKNERQAAVQAILASGNIPAGMELFSAGDESQMTVIKRWIDESDIFLLILGGRYGSIEPNSGKSYIQLEYEYALQTDKPLFTVIINENALELKLKKLGSSVMEMEHPKELNRLKSLVKKKLVKFWDDEKDIKLSVYETLNDFTYNKDLVGWIKGDKEVNSGALAEEIARLTKENSELRDELETTKDSSKILYNNLTYDQLKDLLEKNEIEFKGDKISLFIFFKFFAKQLKNKWLSGEELNAAQELSLFKVIRISKPASAGAQFDFTEGGHDFYLRTLVEKEQFDSKAAANNKKH